MNQDKNILSEQELDSKAVAKQKSRNRLFVILLIIGLILFGILISQIIIGLI